MEIYQLSGVKFTYPLAQKPALEDIDMVIEEGEFLVICGQSGCGKSTLLRQLKPILAPHGQKEGTIVFGGELLEDLDQRSQAQDIGFVLQCPDNQVVTDKVWHELAFGLESLGYDTQTIRLRVAEMASFFGIQHWFHREVSTLSGGQKQLLNLAAIMTMQPRVLILDEPTAQLDPIAAGDFLATLQKINRELGTTIIMTEQRLEEVLPMADRVVVMEQGRILVADMLRNVGKELRKRKHPMFSSFPAPMQIYGAVAKQDSFPLSVKEGRRWIGEVLKDFSIEQKQPEKLNRKHEGKLVLRLKDIWFRYEKQLPDVIRDFSMEVYEGEIYCIVGGNGTGKSTMLSLISGLYHPQRGKIWLNGQDCAKMSAKDRVKQKLGALPQNPQHLFVKQTVLLDLEESFRGRNIDRQEQEKRLNEVISFMELEHILSLHPYDLSGGEQQRVALAKILLMESTILLLDEPTKGLDGIFKVKLAELLRQLTKKGMTIIMVSHDLEFCARYGDICSLFFDGKVITTGQPVEFFAGNQFYTTAANRMVRHICPQAITVEDVIELCRK